MGILKICYVEGRRIKLHLAPPSHPGHFVAIGKPEQHGRKASHCGSIEITCRAHSISACLYHIYMAVVLHAHRVDGESHIQHNVNRMVATLAAMLG